MKILQVVPYFYPAWSYGGPAKVVYDTATTLSNMGHTVTVYTSDAFDNDHRMPMEKRIQPRRELTVHYFRNLINSWAYTYNLHLPLGLFFTAIFEIKKSDVIHIHDFYTLANVWITFLAWLYKVPYGISVHGCLESKRIEQKAVYKKIFLSLFGIRMMKRARFLVATSDMEYDAYQEYGINKKKIVRIGHGVLRSEFETETTRKEARAELTVPQDAILFTFIGRFHYIKGVDLLLDAFSKIQNTNTWLLLAGSDDGYLDEVKKRIENSPNKHRILLKGPCTGEEKARVFTASDAFVYPSRSEGFSLGILEAGSTGLPLLITDQCHFDEVGKIQAGIVVPVTEKGIYTALQSFIDMDKAKRMSMSQTVVDYIEKKYSMESIATQLLRAYGKSD